MNTKQVFVILVAMLFLAVSIVGAQAGKTINTTRSNTFRSGGETSSDPGNSSPSDATTVNSSKSNSSFRDSSTTGKKAKVKSTDDVSETGSTASFKGKGKNPKTDSINLNSSRSNVYRQSSGDKDVKPTQSTKSDTLKKKSKGTPRPSLGSENGSMSSY